MFVRYRIYILNKIFWHRSVLHDEHDGVRSRFIILKAAASMRLWNNIDPEKYEKLQEIIILCTKCIHLSYIIIQ